ncbi:MAG: DMT family transporter [Paracoccaceae bacterium]
MNRKDHVDTTGAIALTVFALHLAFNQVVIKVTNEGFGPIFSAGARSFGAMLVVVLWIYFRQSRLTLQRDSIKGGTLLGVLFAVEFMCLFSALDFTSVSRISIIFYSMPVWLALAAHFLLPGERLTSWRLVGLVLAMAGVAIAVADRSGDASLLGDGLALIGAICWAGIALTVRLSALSKVEPSEQLLWQLMVSAPLLLIAAYISGDIFRDPEMIHFAGMAFQIIAVASFGFLAWFWLMSVYPASGVASFSFLSPVFSVLLGWLLLREDVGISIWIALLLVAVGIVLINRKPNSA